MYEVMIIDSHCHAWKIWPYLPEVPDPENHGSIELLLNKITLNNVNLATIVCAEIFNNFDNNVYVFDKIRNYPDKFLQLADIDSMWSKTYHTKGATNRLENALKKYNILGFTHYVAEEDDASWFNSSEGLDFFKFANDNKLIASLAIKPNHQKELRKLAERFPNLNILCHHMSGLTAKNSKIKKNLIEVKESSKLDNIHLKFSGFHYVDKIHWKYPYDDSRWIFEECYNSFNKKMCWGSDFPVVQESMTYKQTIEALRKNCNFIDVNDMNYILGETLNNLIKMRFS